MSSKKKISSPEELNIKLVGIKERRKELEAGRKPEGATGRMHGLPLHPPLVCCSFDTMTTDSTAQAIAGTSSTSTTVPAGHAMSTSPPLRSALRSPELYSSPTASATDVLRRSVGSPSSSTGTPSKSTSSVHVNQYGFVNRVSFDATEGGSGHGGGVGIEQSFTLKATTPNFKRTRESRTFLVATDLNEYSVHALEWTLDNLIEHGDEVVVLRVFDPLASATAYSMRSNIGETAREEAQILIERVMERNYSNSDLLTPVTSRTENSDSTPVAPRPDATREIAITVEFVVGKVQTSIQKMIAIYRPDSLVVGTRGRADSMWKAAFIGSVSKYCVANSPVPVIVVRPAIKVRQSKNKREGRQTYADLLHGGKKQDNLVKQTANLSLYKASTMPVHNPEGEEDTKGEKKKKMQAPSGDFKLNIK